MPIYMHRQCGVNYTKNQFNVNHNEVTLEVCGILNARAETFVAFFHVLQIGETAEKTDSLMSRRIRKFAEGLKSSGIENAVMKTDVISFVPKYELNVVSKLFSKSYNEVPAGFELQKNVIVEYKKSSDLDKIVSAATGAEIYDLVKVDYFITDVKKQYDLLRLQCMLAMKERMKSYELLGVNLETAKRSIVEDFSTVMPQQRYNSYQAVARPSLKALKKMSDEAKVNYADLTPSRYYNAVSYDQYDVVINPSVNEPMVQLTYYVKMVFRINADPPQPTVSAKVKNNVMLITPNGDLHHIDVDH
jgi:uncharacterized protein YggE